MLICFILTLYRLKNMRGFPTRKNKTTNICQNILKKLYYLVRSRRLLYETHFYRFDWNFTLCDLKGAYYDGR
jgi:hypothetical protein